MRMADKRPKRMLMVVMYRAEHNQITQIWADLDKEGLGSKKEPPARSKHPPWQSQPECSGRCGTPRGRGWATGRPATASGARACCLRSRRFISISDESQDLCLDDVLISDAFDRLLAIARKNGAIGSLDPQFHNYHHIPLLNM
jgi:hypothetical protein